MAAAVRGKKGRKCSVLVKTVQKRNDDGQAATAQHVRRKDAVFAAKYQKRNQNPKSGVTLRKAIHIKPPTFSPQEICTLENFTCGFLFLIYSIPYL